MGRKRTSGRTWTVVATAAVAAHLAIGIAHQVAHDGLGVGLTRFQDLFVQVFYLALPLLAAVLIWTPLTRAGAWILSTSMAASLVFGLWFHFIAVSADHVAHLPAGDDQLLFQVTAVAMGLIDVAGLWLGLRLIRTGDQDSRARHQAR